MTARHRLCRDDPSRPRLGGRRGEQGLSHGRASIPIASLIGAPGRRRAAGGRARSAELIGATPRATLRSAPTTARSADATWSMSRPTCRPTIGAERSGTDQGNCSSACAASLPPDARARDPVARCRPASPARCRCRRRSSTIRSRRWSSAARSSARRKPERFIVGCADPRRRCPRRCARSSKRSAARSCRCATRAPSLPRSPSIAAWWRRSRSPTRWPSSASGSAPTGRRSSPALKLDRRIGPYAYLSPGLGIAGGNLERDLRRWCRSARRKRPMSAW